MQDSESTSRSEATVRRKGYIPPHQDLVTRIAFAIFDHGMPLTKAQISKAVGEPHQKIGYWLPKMTIQGLLIEIEVEGSDAFSLQPFLMDPDLVGELTGYIAQMVPAVMDGIENPNGDMALANIGLFLRLIQVTQWPTLVSNGDADTGT